MNDFFLFLNISPCLYPAQIHPEPFCQRSRTFAMLLDGKIIFQPLIFLNQISYCKWMNAEKCNHIWQLGFDKWKDYHSIEWCYYLKIISFISLHFYFLHRSLDTILSSAVQGLSVLESHLVEVEGDTLCLYGAGALECLDRNWSVQTAGVIVTVSFMFIEFDEIVQALTKLKIKFPNSVVRMPQISAMWTAMEYVFSNRTLIWYSYPWVLSYK